MSNTPINKQGTKVIEDLLKPGVFVNLEKDGDLFRVQVLRAPITNELVVTMPVSRGQRVPMAQGQEIYLLMDMPDSLLLLAMLRYEDADTVGDKLAAVFELLQWDIRDCTRRTFRLRVSDPCSFTVFSLFDPTRVAYSDSVPMFDLSEGGLSVIAATKPPTNAFAECCFMINGEQMKVKARVAHTSPAARPGCHKIGFEFIQLPLNDRRTIRKFIYAEQMKRIRRS